MLRQFGSRDGLVTAAMDAAMADTAAERRTPAGDVRAAVHSVVQRYERRGRTAVLMLAQESHDELARRVTDRGKAMHREWVRDAFSPATADDALLDLLVVATDVYTWKLLRLDREHSQAVTERRIGDRAGTGGAQLRRPRALLRHLLAPDGERTVRAAAPAARDQGRAAAAGLGAAVRAMPGASRGADVVADVLSRGAGGPGRPSVRP